MSETPAKGQLRADEYRAKGHAATEMADAAGLVHVRERHAVAAATWFRMADAEDQRLETAQRNRDRLTAAETN